MLTGPDASGDGNDEISRRKAVQDLYPVNRAQASPNRLFARPAVADDENPR